ncbi:MAG: DUF1080 domain-containing protein [bacterium]
MLIILQVGGRKSTISNYLEDHTAMKRAFFVLIVTMAASVTSLALAGVPQADTNGWQSLFDGKTLGKWKPSSFIGCGKIDIKDSAIAITTGSPMSGITWSNEPPARMDYELQLEARRTEGHDFFCGLTFPVGTNPCTLIVGGWGGNLTGLSSINGYDASENETTSTFEYESNRWYKITLKVTKGRIEAWINDQQVVNLETEDKKFSIRWEVEPSVPLGISTWRTSSAIRNIRIRQTGS